MIRVLIVEDSAVQRELIRFVLEDASFDVVGTAADGEEAVAQAALLRPDVILMDCHLPKLDGVDATRQIMETTPTPIVITSASTESGTMQRTFEAIGRGALAIVSKPPALDSPDFDKISSQLVRTLQLMSEVKVVRRWPERAVSKAPRANPSTVGILAMVGSTGAPSVIAGILQGLGPQTSVPILIVQHMIAGFVGGFAGWLSSYTGIPTEVAADGVVVLPGRAYLAPDGAQLGIQPGGRLVLSGEEGDDGFRPSGNHLLNSVAAAYGSRALGIVLTGMGRDGAAGLAAVQRAGGITIAQDEASSVVFGMPREAIRLDAAQHVLAPAQMIEVIADITRS